MTDELLFDRPISVPEELAGRAKAKGWPDDLVERALQLGYRRVDINDWLSDEHVTVAEIVKEIDWKERLRYGTIRVREATWADNDALADMYANAPEDAGEWEVIVERSPYPFAQFRLQERASVQLVEDRGVILASSAYSTRNTIVEGQRISAHFQSAWRVRRESRGQGYSRLLNNSPGPATLPFGFLFYWYMRSTNQAGPHWLSSLRRDLAQQYPPDQAEPPGLKIAVHRIKARPFSGDLQGIRKVRRSDTRRCVSLINRTHRGLDLFRPYSTEFLHGRLDDPMWGPKPDHHAHVYSWEDYVVLEERGQIIACAGLWDRGRHMREVWVRKSTGERVVVDDTAMMDFGYAQGREDAMERLIGCLLGLTDELGRQDLLAAIESLPDLVARVTPYKPELETRQLLIHPESGKNEEMKVRVKRPYTDIAYW